MHVMGIMGSPRRNSNTEILLDAVLHGAVEGGATTETVRVCESNVGPCRELYHCAVDGNCSIVDDMTPLYGALAAADRIVLASPIFFYGLSSQVKALVDRCQALWIRRYVLKTWNPDLQARRGLFVAVGATRGPRLFDGVLLTAKYFFDAVGVRDFDRLLVRGVDGRGEVTNHPDFVEQAREAGRKLVAS